MGQIRSLVDCRKAERGQQNEICLELPCHDADLKSQVTASETVNRIIEPCAIEREAGRRLTACRPLVEAIRFGHWETQIDRPQSGNLV